MKTLLILTNNQIKGVRTILRKVISRMTQLKTFSGFCVAKTLGVISPKIKISMVMIPVTIAVAFPTLLSGNKFKAIKVAKDEAKIFTKLLKTKIVVNSLFGSCNAFSTTLRFSLESAFSANSFNLSLVMELRAVSEPEKRPDNNNIIPNKTNCKINELLLKGSGSTRNPTALSNANNGIFHL
jgi:hypothetical protein